MIRRERSLRGTLRGISMPGLPWLVAVLTAYVADRIVPEHGWLSLGHESTVGICATSVLVLGLGVIFGLLPRLRRREQTWVLSTEQVVPAALSYREATEPSIRDLVDRLGRAGYRLQARRFAASGALVACGDDRASLAGLAVELRDDQSGACIIVRVSDRATVESGGLGLITAVRRGGRSASEELALFAICELAELLPGLRFAELGSTLPPDGTEMLRASLPERGKVMVSR